MRQFTHGFFVVLALAGFCLPARAQSTNVFELLEGDRVALIGDALIEREQTYGCIEFVLTTYFPERNVMFRNLGWSGDTPAGISRAGFDPAEKGFDRLKEQVSAFKPTVVFLGYGMASSFDGSNGIPKFTAEMNQLMDTIQQLSGDKKVRFVLMSPFRHEKMPAPLPDPTVHNQQLELYSKAIEEIAAKRAAHYVNLFKTLDNRVFGLSAPPITDDGIHLTSYGYRRAAEVLAGGLNWNLPGWRFGITPEKTLRDGTFGTKLIEFAKKDDGFRAVTLEDRLVMPPLLEMYKEFPTYSGTSRMQVVNLKPGRYQYRVDGKVVKVVGREDIQKGMFVDAGPQFDQAEELRQAIVRKNELFFYRWRPQNNTYLFLFRKHEQGNNAAEISMFDPLIEAEEKKIAKLRQPVQHTIELVWNDLAVPPAPPPAKKDKSPVTDYKPLPLPEFIIEPGYEISVWAENPLLAKPIQMNFDPQGRLWVASSSVYPQIKPGEVADDKILILEDTDGDGKADKSTVFADGLLIPTGVEPGDGGVYVGQSTELLHFKDTDGDGKADQRRVVLSGFGTEDTHHILHTLRWGYDGQLYFDQSIYIHSHLETPHGVVRLNSGGIFNLRPATMELDVFLKGFCNPWGHHFDEYGQSFVTDGAGGQGISWGIRGATYFTYAGLRRELKSVSPGSYPKFCGLETIYSEHFPKDWQGNFITCDFRANRVVRFSIEEQASGYVTKAMPDLLRTKSTAFRPIDVKVGPDGAIYIADWSNPIIQHGEVDFRDPRRDHEHGRIWRVTAKGRPALKKPELVKASNTELFNQLLSPNGFNREKAKRVLTERGATNISAELGVWTKMQKTEKNLLEALWAYQAIDQVEPELLEKMLNAKDPHVRVAVTRVLSFWHNRVKAPLDLLAARVADEHPRVRVEAVRALAKLPSARSAELALSALEKPMDNFIDYALWLTINDLAEPWLAAIESGAWKPEGREKQLEFGLKAIEPALATKLLAKILKNIPRDGAGGSIELIGQAGGPGQLRQMFDQAAQGGFDDAATARALSALNEASRLRNAKPTGDLAGVTKFIESKEEKIRAAAARLAGSWKQSSATPALLKIAGDTAATVRLRQAAFDGLREIGGDESVTGLRALAGKTNDVATRRQAVMALAGANLAGSLPQVLEILNVTTKEEDALALWRSLLSGKSAAATFAKALAKTNLPEATARAGVRVAREGGRNEPDLVLALNRAGGLSDGTQGLTDEELHAIAYNVTKGDAVKGETIYRRKELGCMPCHAIGGAGGKVGPDMTSLGASAVTDYIVESVLLPNKKVKEGFQSIQVTTKSGEDLSGILVRENNEELVLRDATGKELSVPKKNVETRKIGGSLMPAGLVDILSGTERLDLFRFLTELGKPGAFDATKGTVARVWRVNSGMTATGAEDILKSNVTDNSKWAPIYSTVAGALLKSDLQAEQSSAARREPLFAAARFQTSKAGAVKLRLSGVNSPKAWVDGKPVGGDNEMSLELPAGTHTFILKVNTSDMAEQVRLETADGSFLVD